MSIEVRNFRPRDYESNISIDSSVEFDIVALDNYSIDITSINIIIETNSNIDSEIHSTTYDHTSKFLSYSGTDHYYHIVVDSEIPYDEGLTVTVSVNISGLDNNNSNFMMDEFVSHFYTIYNGVISDFRYVFINAAEKIPVYNEVLRKDSSTAPKVFDSAYDKWNKDKFTKIQLNQIIIKADDLNYPYHIDYNNGRIIFDNPLSYNDEVDASYTFRFFSDQEIQSFFKMAVAEWRNAVPYGGPSNIYSADQTMRGILMIGAALYAFRELLMQLAIQERRIIFDNTSLGDGWTNIKDLWKTIYDSYAEAWKSAKEEKKNRLYSIAAIVQPEFTLPGGRSRYFRYLYKGTSS
jgi:hypothetical protein